MNAPTHERPAEPGPAPPRRPRAHQEPLTPELSAKLAEARRLLVVLLRLEGATLREIAGAVDAHHHQLVRLRDRGAGFPAAKLEHLVEVLREKVAASVTNPAAVARCARVEVAAIAAGLETTRVLVLRRVALALLEPEPPAVDLVAEIAACRATLSAVTERQTP